jgi:hypothetical protein
MNKEYFDYWTKFRASKSNRITKKGYSKICEIHSVLFSHGYFEPCTCNPKGVQKFIKDINKIYDDRQGS